MNTEHTDMSGYGLDLDGGKGYWWWGATTVNKLESAATQGRMDAAVQFMPAGYAPPRHSHESDEFFYVLEGELRVVCGERTWSARTGSFVFFPIGSVHGFEVVSDTPARMLIVTAGANFAELVSSLGEATDERGLPPEGHGEVSMDDMVRVSERLGIRYTDA